MPFRHRPDGDYVADVPAVRKIMPFIMPTRAESTVYFEQRIDLEKPMAFVQEFRAQTGLRVTMLHVYIWALGQIMRERPRLNRFTMGGRIFQRRGTWVSFSAKKAKTDDDPIILVKKQVDPAASFERLVRHVEGGIVEGRSDAPSSTDKELALIFKLPAFLIMPLTRILMKLDQWGWLPGFFVEGDAMYTSVFIANLGSVGLDAGFHHLFEYGNCPIFMAIGQTKAELVIGPERQPVVRDMQTIRYTFDERIEDGLYCAQALERFKAMVEDPRAHGILQPKS